jgi:hypothetical protein
MIRVLKGSFLDREKSFPGDFEYSRGSRESISCISIDFKTIGFIVHLLAMIDILSLQGPLLLALIYGQ